MALKLTCDGCACDLQPADASTIGRYDPCVFCKDCVATWRAHEAAQRAKHAEIVKTFEAWRAKALADLKAGGMARVPDEG